MAITYFGVLLFFVIFLLYFLMIPLSYNVLLSNLVIFSYIFRFSFVCFVYLFIFTFPVLLRLHYLLCYALFSRCFQLIVFLSPLFLFLTSDPIYVITEYLAKGDLQKVLTECKPNNTDLAYCNIPGLGKSMPQTFVKFARDVANGMAFLSSQRVNVKDVSPVFSIFLCGIFRCFLLENCFFT